MKADNTQSAHLNYLDGLRALAAIFVVIHHAYLEFNFSQEILGGYKKIIQIFLYGHYAVDLFIVISGFCLMLPIIRGDGKRRGSLLKFFKKRARRIIPPYYLAILFSLLLIWLLVGKKTGTHWDLSIPVTFQGVLAHFFLIQDATDYIYEINHPLWSISVEWRIYFLFPLLVIGWQRFGAIKTTLLAISVSDFLAYFLYHNIGRTLTSQYIGLFALGMLGAAIAYSDETNFLKLRHKISWMPIFLIFTVLVIIISTFTLGSGKPLPIQVPDFFVGWWSMILLIIAARSGHNRLQNFLAWRPLVFVGTFSYSIYLIHAPLIQVIWQYLVHPLNLKPFPGFLFMAILGIPIIACISYIFFYFCERPFLNKLPPKQEY